jgi:hypothetical protein
VRKSPPSSDPVSTLTLKREAGTLPRGSDRLYHEVIKLLEDNGVLEKLDRLHEAAIAFRKQEEEFLVQNDAKIVNREDLYFYYPAEESEEFE